MKGMINRKAGFTMLELIMVIIIIGILAALAVPQYTNFMEKARAAEGVNTIGAMKTAEMMYKMETGGYTGTIGSLDIDVPTTGAGTYWTYALASGATTNFTVTAIRSTKKTSTANGQTIELYWDDNASPYETWRGDHVGVPK